MSLHSHRMRTKTLVIFVCCIFCIRPCSSTEEQCAPGYTEPVQGAIVTCTNGAPCSNTQRAMSGRFNSNHAAYHFYGFFVIMRNEWTITANVEISLEFSWFNLAEGHYLTINVCTTALCDNVIQTDTVIESSTGQLGKTYTSSTGVLQFIWSMTEEQHDAPIISGSKGTYDRAYGFHADWSVAELTTCTRCVLGTYLPANETGACKTCPLGTSSQSGSIAVTDCICNNGSFGPPGGPCTCNAGYSMPKNASVVCGSNCREYNQIFTETAGVLGNVNFPGMGFTCECIIHSDRTIVLQIESVPKDRYNLLYIYRCFDASCDNQLLINAVDTMFSTSVSDTYMSQTVI